MKNVRKKTFQRTPQFLFSESLTNLLIEKFDMNHDTDKSNLKIGAKFIVRQLYF